MKFLVELAQLVRQTCLVTVEAPSRKALAKKLSGVYEAEQGDSPNWEDDNHWGADEGTHTLLDEEAADTDQPDFLLDEDGDVQNLICLVKEHEGATDAPGQHQ